MRQSVADAFTAFSTKFEGSVDFPYLDVKCLVTSGIGDLLEPVGVFIGQPWRHRATGERATAMAAMDGYHAVKARTELAQHGGMAFRTVTDLYLDQDAIKALVAGRLRMNEAILRQRFPKLDEWPADAQLALHSMAWAMGPAFQFPHFERAVNADPPDWEVAAHESHMSDGAPSRNAANYRLLMSAAQGGDPGVLCWP